MFAIHHGKVPKSAVLNQPQRINRWSARRHGSE
jgi:hypothetical protein